ncbi:MAG: hypothetical protein WDO70_03960 [Alphaproteobacteria bacterium]
MQMIYQNFDGLDVAFQGSLPPSILEALEQGKQQALAQGEDALVLLGLKQCPVLVAETGARGGYAYRFDTGPAGEVWFVSKSIDPKRWNIRVSVKSLNFGLNGYAAVKQNSIAFLTELGAYGVVRGLTSDNHII